MSGVAEVLSDCLWKKVHISGKNHRQVHESFLLQAVLFILLKDSLNECIIYASRFFSGCLHLKIAFERLGRKDAIHCDEGISSICGVSIFFITCLCSTSSVLISVIIWAAPMD